MTTSSCTLATIATLITLMTSVAKAERLTVVKHQTASVKTSIKLRHDAPVQTASVKMALSPFTLLPMVQPPRTLPSKIHPADQAVAATR